MPETVEYILGGSNLFSRAHSLAAGEVIDWHAHSFDHGTWIFLGRVRVQQRHPVTGEVLPDVILTPTSRDTRKVVVFAGWEHRIEALEDAEIECNFAHHDAQARVSQRFTGYDTY